MGESWKVHDEHRKRLRDRFLKHGLDSFQPHEVLELLLFYAIPRKNTNIIAHELMNKFGSIQSVLNAPCSSLSRIKGVGSATTCFLKLILNVARMYIENNENFVNILPSRNEINNHLVNKFIGRTEEMIAIVLLDAKRKVLFDGVLSNGTHNSVDMNVRKVIELISFYNAAAISFAHNHPSGIALPSKEDVETTKRLKYLFDTMNVCFIDHIIVADGDYISFRDCNLPGVFDSNFSDEDVVVPDVTHEMFED